MGILLLYGSVLLSWAVIKKGNALDVAITGFAIALVGVIVFNVSQEQNERLLGAGLFLEGLVVLIFSWGLSRKISNQPLHELTKEQDPS